MSKGNLIKTGILPTEIPRSLLQIIDAETAWHYKIIPVKNENGKITCVTTSENDPVMLEPELELVLGSPVNLVLIDEQELLPSLSNYYRTPASTPENKGFSETISLENTDFLEQLILEANNIGCSDIHLEPFEENCRVRFRIDGKLVERFLIPIEQYPAWVNKIKIKARLDIAEKRLPQDGRIAVEGKGVSGFDIRISVLPTIYGEKIVLRLLSRNAGKLDVNELGFAEKDLKLYLEAIRKHNGLVLLSGPTGSGKTTTLYATLKELNHKDTNILTVEDPVEYTLNGINQVQVRHGIGLDFSKALKTFLRQDPDIIMLGEIRDKETAEMAIRASLTGHLVLSTLHTNSALGIVTRLLDMGIAPYLIADTLNMAVAQRLIRVLCPKCKTKSPLSSGDLPFGFKKPYPLESVFHPKGCSSCHFTGFYGRRAIYEVVKIDEQITISVRRGVFDPFQITEQQHIITLKDHAFKLLAEGTSSPSELFPLLLGP